MSLVVGRWSFDANEIPKDGRALLAWYDGAPRLISWDSDLHKWLFIHDDGSVEAIHSAQVDAWTEIEKPPFWGD